MNKIKGIELHTHKLEERDKQFREKMENKRKQQAEKEMMELKKQKEEERKRRDKVLKTSPDDVAFRLTKSMEARGNKVSV